MNGHVNLERLGREILIQDPFLGQVWLAFAKKYTDSGDVALGEDPDDGLALFIGPNLFDHTPFQQVQLIRYQLWHLLLDHWNLSRMYPSDNRLYAALDESVRTQLSGESTGLESLSSQYKFMLEHPEVVSRWAQQKEKVARYRFWRKPEKSSTDCLSPFLRKQASEWIQMYGTDPGSDAKRYSHTVLTAGEQVLPWRRILRYFVLRSGTVHLRHTHRRPSRRYPSSPGLRKMRLPRLVVVVDTSASIGDTQWTAFFREIEGLKRSGAQVTILEADVIVQRTWSYHRGIPHQGKGGGGTAFDHAIRTAESVHRPDAILYFTDGQGPAPVDWKGTPLLWVLTQKNDQLPGRSIKLSV